MSTEDQKKEMFLNFIVAAMLDAAVEMKLTQLKSTIIPPGATKEKLVRIIIVPEMMEHEFPQGLGARQ